MSQLQRDEIDSVKQKIRALTAKTIDSGCSKAEAELAMEKASELLDRYELTMDEVVLHNEMCAVRYVDSGQRKKNPVTGCVVPIADFCDCFVWKTWSPNQERKRTMHYAFFGLESDAEMAEYLCRLIMRAVKTETARFKRGTQYQSAVDGGLRRSMTCSFQNGLVLGIADKLQTMKRHRKEHVEYERRQHIGKDIVHLKQVKVEEELEKQGFRKPKYVSNHRRVGSYSAAAAGRSAADNVNLSRPVSRGGKVRGYIE